MLQQMSTDLWTDINSICFHGYSTALVNLLDCCLVETMARSHLSTVSKGTALSEED